LPNWRDAEVVVMDRPDLSTWFLGDLDDPWVSAIAGRLPACAQRLDCAGEFPPTWPEGIRDARTIVAHRAVLTDTDLARLKGLIERSASSNRRARIVLCVGPHARYHDLQRWSAWVDVVLPEATAPETIGRHLCASAEPRALRQRGEVTLVSGLEELRYALTEACEEAGYSVAPKRDWPDEVASDLVVWDVPVLDDEWPIVLGRAARRSRIVALIGFADRVSVSVARAQGAAACLDLPCDPADLVHVLDRLSADAETRAQAGTAPSKRISRHKPSLTAGAPKLKPTRARTARPFLADPS
jgi:hypothetical protein